MATAKQAESKVAHLETYVRGQLAHAQKRLGALEGTLEKEAGRALKSLAARKDASRKELEALLARLDTAELRKLLAAADVKGLGKRASKARSEVRRRLDGLQCRVVEALGLASQAQVKDIHRELAKLAKKLDAALGTKKERAEKDRSVAAA